MSFAIVTAIVLALDQLLKLWVTKNIPLEAVGAECVELIPGVIHMTNYHNYGAAFGILENARWLLVGVAVVFVILVIVLISMEVLNGRLGQWAAVLVMAGAIGNALDRALYGYVIDMFELEFMTFAVFNVADIFVTVAGLLLCVYIIFHKEPEEVREARAGGFRVRGDRATEDDGAEQAPVMRSAARSQSAYDAIPKRGEHKSLDEEFAPIDPNDPFAAWEIGEDFEPAGEEEAAEPGEAVGGLFETEAAAFLREETPSELPEVPAAPAAEETPAEEPDFAVGELEFSLDDILAEFGEN